ncbi:MAG: hypothetical protein KDB03_18525 [Planctomycetales bacterium]|nr:hypothetical protein [Planctomycetales bacterium]
MNHSTSKAKMIAITQSLYRMDDTTDVCDGLVEAYARYKLGDVKVRHRFLKKLACLVITKLGHELRCDPSTWVIATPATTELALDFADLLQMLLKSDTQIPVQIVGPDPCPGSDYTDCSQQQRDSIVSSFYDFKADLTGRRLLIIDDLINTGTALAELSRRLVESGVLLSKVYPFAFVRADFKAPQREAQLVRSVINRMTLDEILSILADPGHYLTSATMLKYLSGRTRNELTAIAAALPLNSLGKLQLGLTRYYGGHAIPEHMHLLLQGPTEQQLLRGAR